MSTSYTFSSTSISSTSRTGPDGQPQTRSYTENTSSDDMNGTTVHRRAEESGRAPVEETNTYPSRSSGKVSDNLNGAGRIEDVSDEQEQRQEQRDQEYEERMEDEYAKREGGA